MLVAADETPAILAAIASADTHILSVTITEKGYCRAPDGGIDRVAAADRTSIYPLLAHRLRRRHAAGLPGLTLLSCDNLANNGRQFRALLLDYVEPEDQALAAWIAMQCRLFSPYWMANAVTLPLPRDALARSEPLLKESVGNW